MKKTTVFSIYLILVSFCLVNLSMAQSHYRYFRDPKIAVYFGHISYTEVEMDGKDPVVWREGKKMPEVAVLNFPIAPGDTIITPKDRRCEIQFDSGTIIRLDTDTEVKVETILAQSLTSPHKLTNFILTKGQIYVMYKEYSSSEILQILFSNASAKFKHKSVLTMRANADGSTDIRVETGQASLLYGPEDHLEKTELRRKDEATILKTDQIQFTQYEGGEDFSKWNFEMNQNFLALHEGVSKLPKPVQRMSPAVFNFAQKFSNFYGEWIWNDIYGYVWRPFANDRYPTGLWQPYYYGYWRKINQDLFWVPQESWGWVPYHLGLWVWDKKTGWLWLPGGAFAPSWTSWNFYFGHFAWRPLTLWDFAFTGQYYTYNSYYYPWYYYSRGDEPASNDYIDQNRGQPSQKPVLDKINKNQLKKGGSSSVSVPKGMRRVLASLLSALKKGDVNVLASINEVPCKTVVVKGDHLSSSSLTKWMLEFDQMSDLIQNGLMMRDPSVNPLGYANQAFRRNDFIASLAQNLIVTPSAASEGKMGNRPFFKPSVWISDKTQVSVEGGSVSEKNRPAGSVSQSDRRPFPSSLTTRVRDWNPDVKVAVRTGVTLRYSSLENAVRVPELERTSGTAGRRGAFNFSRSGSTVSSSSSSGSSASSSSSSAGQSSSSGSSSSGSSGSRSTGTKAAGSKVIKKF